MDTKRLSVIANFIERKQANLGAKKHLCISLMSFLLTLYCKPNVLNKGF